MIKLEKKAKVNFHKSGSGSIAVKVIIPKDIAEHMELKNGDYVTFQANNFGKAVHLVKEDNKNV